MLFLPEESTVPGTRDIGGRNRHRSCHQRQRMCDHSQASVATIGVCEGLHSAR